MDSNTLIGWNGEPAGGNIVLASTWTEKKWLQMFSGLQSFAFRVILVSASIVYLALLVTKIHQPSPSCVVGNDQNDVMFVNGSASVILLSFSIIIVPGMKLRIRGLSSVELARQRYRLNAGYILATFFIIVGVTFTGIAMMDVFQIIFGLWSCGSPFTVTLVVLSAFFTMVADGYLVYSLHYVIYTP